MLPYEILIGLRGTMCTCARGLISKQNVLIQTNVKLQHCYQFSTVALINKSSLQVTHQNVNINNNRRFHSQLSANCQASPKDTKSTESKSIKELVENHINLNLKMKTPKQNAEEGKIVLSGNVLNKIPEPVRKWLISTTEKAPSRDIERMFPESKTFLHNFFTVVANERKSPHCLTSNYKHVQEKKKVMWSYTYNITWPEHTSFTSVGNSKASASMSAALKCLYWLHLNGRIRNRQPVIYEKNEAQSLLNSPTELKINNDILNKIDNFLNEYKEKIDEAVLAADTQDVSNIGTNNMMHEKHLISKFQVDIASRNSTLKERFEKKIDNTNPELPIFKFRSQILKELDENQALVIKGDTGCGKTTQVPQFLMDHFASRGKGSDCSMIVTQPRRISAISLAERIAYERGEKLGDVVGYQVRLQQLLPQQHGAILFCTTGVLLKKLQSNLTLVGCSHVIIDEAHERSVQTDMLLVLLKRAMQKNPSLKVIVMSATINADLFQEYLGCNAVEVPGRLFPVKMNFLEDIYKLGILKRKIVQNSEEEEEGPIIDCDQITDLIRYISGNKAPGAILCFLPGWGHIQRVQLNLEQYSHSKLNIIPLHSKIPYLTQSKIFNPSLDGVRKVILATDIAETGITVPDVVYVIDSACHKEVRWHESRGLSSINVHWISKANLNQRKGRAGRVQPGESYHFMSKQQYETLDAYPLPEVLRVSLEQIVLDGKTYSNEKAENFLGSMPQPPRRTAVQKAVSDLQILGALDNDQNLTPLGKRIALFSIHPRLSKAMVYSVIFQCLSPVTTIAAALSMDSELFYGVLNNKSRIRETKMMFHPTSDHIAMAWIYSQWESYIKKGRNDAYLFCRRNGVHAERINILQKVREQNLDHLRETGLIENSRDEISLHCQENEYAVLDELSRGVLLAGMDQILKHREFEIRKSRLTKSGTSMVTEDGAKAQLTPECVNYKRKQWASPFLVYYQKTHHHERRTTLIRESSMISPVTLLLFSQGRVTGTVQKDENQNEEKVLLQIDGKRNVNLICDVNTAKTILRFRDVMWSIARYYVENNRNNESTLSQESLNDTIWMYKEQMMSVLANLLNSASTKIDCAEANTRSLKTSNDED